MTQNGRALYPAFARDDNTPLAESITPIIGDKAVYCALYPEGSVTALGYLDPVTGDFVGTSGHFRTFRKQDLYQNGVSKND